MSCILRAGGQHFDVDAYCAATNLCVYLLRRKGEKRHPNSATNDTIYESSSVQIEASKADFCELPKQIADVILFLQQNGDDVKALSNFAGVEDVEFDFGADISSPYWASFVFPTELLVLLGATGASLCLSVYPTAEVNEIDDDKFA
jgi:hypothetical protein